MAHISSKPGAWVLAMIEARTKFLFQKYFEPPEAGVICMAIKDAYELVKSYEFQYWYFYPTELEMQVGERRDICWAKYKDWSRSYRIYMRQQASLN